MKMADSEARAGFLKDQAEIASVRACQEVVDALTGEELISTINGVQRNLFGLAVRTILALSLFMHGEGAVVLHGNERRVLQ